jgi:hypothetical protein
MREFGLNSSVCYSFSFDSWSHIRQWLEVGTTRKIQPLHLLYRPNYFLYLYRNKMVSCSYVDRLFLSFCVFYPISVLISSQGLCSLEQIPLQSTIPPNAPSPVHHGSKYPLFIIPSHPWHPPSPHVTQCTILIIFTTFCKLNTFISKFPLFTYYSSHSILQTKHWMVKSWKRSYSIV